MLFRVINVQHSELIILAFFIYMRSVYQVFYIYGILVHSQSVREHAEHLVILLLTLHQE